MADDTARRRTRVAISAVDDEFSGIREVPTMGSGEEDMAKRNEESKSVPSLCSGERSGCKALTEKGVYC